MTNQEDYECPLVAVDRRLSDAHRLWHRANNNYFNPDEFRIDSQLLIQTLRTVTFVLQNNKSIIPDFDSWYAKHQEKLKAIPLMRWLVDARNKIEKQGDLETKSMVRAQIIASHLDELPVMEVEAKIFDDVSELFARVPRFALEKQVLRHGVLRIERRWVDADLPNFELMEALAEAYGHLSDVVRDAHRQLGLPEPALLNEESGDVEHGEHLRGRLPCMIAHEDPRALLIHLGDGSSLSFAHQEERMDLVSVDEIEARYGQLPPIPEKKDESLEDVAHRFFQMARFLIEKDGYHIPMVFLLRGGEVVKNLFVPTEDRQEKYLLSRELAVWVRKCRADGIIFVGEWWVSSLAKPEFFEYPVDRDDKTEAVALAAAGSNGENFMLSANIIRNGGVVTLEETKCTKYGYFFYVCSGLSSVGPA